MNRVYQPNPIGLETHFRTGLLYGCFSVAGLQALISW